MGTYSISEAINLLLEKSKWKHKVTELRMQQEWEEIVGKTIARYTRNVKLNGDVLTVFTDVAALKQELYFGKVQLAERINDYFKEKVVADIIVK